MQARLWMMIALLGFFPMMSSASERAQPHNAKSIAGLWTVISDKTHKPRSVIELSFKGNQVVGRVVRVFKQKGDNALCDKCPAPFKNKKVMGMQLLWGLKKNDDNQWTGGSILDPKSGRIYSLNAKLDKQGSKLMMRGYIGFSLLGRTQTWLRRESL
jgi:uncharacterized protein (DUF2147 family)